MCSLWAEARLGSPLPLRSAEKGLRVMVADSARPPIDKACGEGILPRGVATLRAPGFEIASGQPEPFCEIRFVDAQRDASVSVDALFPRGCAFGLRRTLLHAGMVTVADAAADPHGRSAALA